MPPADPALIAACAILLDATLGTLLPRAGRYGLTPLAERLGPELERRLNRRQRTWNTLVARGAAAMLVLTLAGLGLGQLLAWTTPAGGALFVTLEIVLLAWCLGFGGALGLVLRLEPPLRYRLIMDARGLALRERLAQAEARDLSGLGRGAIERLADRIDRGILSGVLGYLLLGLPGAVALVALRAAAPGLLRPGAPFGTVPLWVERLLGFVPAALASLCLLGGAVLAAPSTPGVSPLRPLAAVWPQLRRHPVPNRGLTLATTAEALGLALCGPPEAPGTWLGDGTAQTRPVDLHRAAKFAVSAVLVLVVALALTALAR